jgi:allantoinase
LTFAAEEVPDCRPDFKCAPPIRGGTDREGLWAGLERGEIDLIATDHSPAPPSLKRVAEGDFLQAWGGIASLQVGLSAVWTGMAARRQPIAHLADWMSAAPARLAGLDARKGAIAPGKDADLLVFDPDSEWTVDARTLYHRHPVTPYADARLRGRVKTTLLRGQVVFDDNECRGEPRGALVSAPLA